MTWTFQQLKPQKARGVLVPEMWTDLGWAAEEKFDGDRRITQFCGKRVRFTGTRESVDGTGFVEKTDNLPHLNDCPSSLDGTVLDGEMVAPFQAGKGGQSKFVTAIMGSSPEKAVVKQSKDGWLTYMVFDCLWFKGEDMRQRPLYQRRNFAGQALKLWNRPHAKLVLPQPGTDKRKFFDQLIKSGREGVVLKFREHTYGNEKLWVKVKGTWTADVVILGFAPGEKKYEGEVGAIIMGQYRDEKGAANYPPDLFGTCRGFTDAQMRDFKARPKKYIGTVIEIEHNGREPSGSFRHPRFKRLRPDKNPKDCIFSLEET